MTRLTCLTRAEVHLSQLIEHLERSRDILVTDRLESLIATARSMETELADERDTEVDGRDADQHLGAVERGL